MVKQRQRHMLDLYLGGHMQFGSVQGHHIIQSTEDQDGDNYGKICYQGATLGEKQETTRRSWGQRSIQYRLGEGIPSPRGGVVTCKGNTPFSNLCGQVTAGLELLERDGHGVRAEEQKERHHGQIRDVFARFAHQGTAEHQALFLTQLIPVQSREVELSGGVRSCVDKDNTRQKSYSDTCCEETLMSYDTCSSPWSNQRCFLGLMERKR